MSTLPVRYEPGLDLPPQEPGPFVQLTALIDGSSSMYDQIAAVNAGLAQLTEELKADPAACHQVDVTLIRFDSTPTIVAGPVLARDLVPPTITSSGLTAMGAAIELGLDTIEQRHAEYQRNGTREYVPWMVLITDGAPTDSTVNATQRIHALAARRRLNFWGVGTQTADMVKLAEICPPDRPPRRLGEGRWSELFQWLSMSMSRVSQSTPGEGVPIPPTDGWSEAYG